MALSDIDTYSIDGSDLLLSCSGHEADTFAIHFEESSELQAAFEELQLLKAPPAPLNNSIEKPASPVPPAATETPAPAPDATAAHRRVLSHAFDPLRFTKARLSTAIAPTAAAAPPAAAGRPLSDHETSSEHSDTDPWAAEAAQVYDIEAVRAHAVRQIRSVIAPAPAPPPPRQGLDVTPGLAAVSAPLPQMFLKDLAVARMPAACATAWRGVMRDVPLPAALPLRALPPQDPRLCRALNQADTRRPSGLSSDSEADDTDLRAQAECAGERPQRLDAAELALDLPLAAETQFTEYASTPRGRPTAGPETSARLGLHTPPPLLELVDGPSCPPPHRWPGLTLAAAPANEPDFRDALSAGAAAEDRLSLWHRCLATHDFLPDKESSFADFYRGVTAQWRGIGAAQLARRPALADLVATVQRDVIRTDHSVPFFALSQILPNHLAVQADVADSAGTIRTGAAAVASPDSLPADVADAAAAFATAAAAALPGTDCHICAPMRALAGRAPRAGRTWPFNWWRLHFLLLNWLMFMPTPEYVQGMADLAAVALAVVAESPAHRRTEGRLRACLRAQAEAATPGSVEPFTLPPSLLDDLAEADGVAFALFVRTIDLHPLAVVGGVQTPDFLAGVNAALVQVDAPLQQLLVSFARNAPRVDHVLFVGVAPAMLLLKRSFVSYADYFRFLDWFFARAAPEKFPSAGHAHLVQPTAVLRAAVVALFLVLVRPWAVDALSTFHAQHAQRTRVHQLCRRMIRDAGQALVQLAHIVETDLERDLKSAKESWAAWMGERSAALMTVQAGSAARALPSTPLSAPAAPVELREVPHRDIPGTVYGPNGSSEPEYAPLPPDDFEREAADAEARRAARAERRARLQAVGPPPLSPADCAARIVDNFMADVGIQVAGLDSVGRAAAGRAAPELGHPLAPLEFDLSPVNNIVQNAVPDTELFLRVADVVLDLTS